jgi:hypothetical protein
MSLTLNRETLSGVRALFAKVLEAFTGGFAWTAGALTRHTAGTTLPAGTLLVVNEATRQAVPVKRARVMYTTAAAATGVAVQNNHLFRVGDFLNVLAGTSAGTITAINTSATAGVDRFVLGFPTAPTVGIGALATGAALINVAGAGLLGATATHVGTANAIALYPTTIQAGASVTALRRGTVYANRINPVVRVDNLPNTIQLSTSA